MHMKVIKNKLFKNKRLKSSNEGIENKILRQYPIAG
tara:strand:- start:306 stop:413 length:108 start_codon:yes stop_codon:yes gene_type:complete